MRELGEHAQAGFLTKVLSQVAMPALAAGMTREQPESTTIKSIPGLELSRLREFN